MTLLDGAGTEGFRTSERTATAGRLDSGDLEILRDDLTDILYADSRQSAEYVFGDTVTAARG